MFVKHALKTHRLETPKCKWISHTLFGAGKAGGARQFRAGRGRQHVSSQQSITLACKPVQRQRKRGLSLVIQGSLQLQGHLETLLNYGQDASQSDFTIEFWYHDEGYSLAHNPLTNAKNREYEVQWKLTNKSAQI